MTGEKTETIALLTPDGDRPELRLDLRRRVLDGLWVGHVCRQDEGVAPRSHDVPPCPFEPLAAPCDQADERPRLANARAVARPTPAEAPVMTTTSRPPSASSRLSALVLAALVRFAWGRPSNHSDPAL